MYRLRISFVLAMTTLFACGWSQPEAAPGQCFSPPGAIGCCGPLAKAANELEGIKTYGCSNGRQRVYQARFTCDGGDAACKSGKYKATFMGHTMAPSTCGNGYAMFDLDDESCPASW